MRYSLPQTEDIRITVHDISGKHLLTLVDKEQDAGYYRVVFDGTGLPSGVYLYSIQAGSFRDTKKMLLMK
ncbi:MAG: T9SS type A sorting domain-containing protein [Candidatus Marinimicrobia bacterium]|nr:T9SS type A sorting domain-containing protein [Candidatus Neomarinimicrobiota bacterium]